MNLNFKNAVPYSENIDKDYYVKDEIFEQYELDEPVFYKANDKKKSGQCCVEECDTVMKQLQDGSTVNRQWSSPDGEIIMSASNTFEKLDGGYYTLHSSQNSGMYFIKEKVNINKLHRLPNEATNIILKDIEVFWNSEEVYKKYKRVYRRNYLLYSAPGTGKTSLINIMCKDLIEKHNGIVITLSDSAEIQLFVDAVRRIRNIEGERKIIAVIEDIDNFVGDGNRSSSLDTLLLNILDGNYKMSNVVIIATTNYIDKLESRYKNRPSRFDRVIEFPLPNNESRKMFIEKTILPEDLDKINIEEWVKKTEGFTIDHINELILLYFVYGHSEKESFEIITNMVNNNNKLTNTSSINKAKLGF